MAGSPFAQNFWDQCTANRIIQPAQFDNDAGVLGFATIVKIDDHIARLNGGRRNWLIFVLYENFSDFAGLKNPRSPGAKREAVAIIRFGWLRRTMKRRKILSLKIRRLRS